LSGCDAVSNKIRLQINGKHLQGTLVFALFFFFVRLVVCLFVFPPSFRFFIF
jgi:hypothetical protein